MKNLKVISSFFFSILFITFLFGIILKNTYYRDTSLEGFSNCVINISDDVPFHSTIIIGHAYGSPTNNSNVEDFIDKNAYAFLKKYSNRIDKVIFSGDIFAKPSLKKWEKLKNDFNDSFKIFIAPGNHDFYDPDDRRIFNLSPFGINEHPITINDKNHFIIAENSIENNWMIESSLQNLVNHNSSQPIIVIRHNIPIKNLLTYANSKKGMSKNLPNFSSFSKMITNKQKIYWIIGDSGAFEHLPRMKCLKKINHTFILNGLGGVINDQVLILANGNFSSYKLRKSNNS
jgi:predicted MPP superfamily phosphohydrolase